jgi:Fe-S-cluster-containing hydrogenase component 2
MNRIKVIKNKCTGCGICEMVSSIAKNKVVNPKKARIRVKDMYPIPGYPVVCIQCNDPLCKKTCPGGAIKINENGTVIINYNKCTKCMKCVDACPFDTMFIYVQDGKPIKCDLYGGDPQCVKYYPTGALIYES